MKKTLQLPYVSLVMLVLGWMLVLSGPSMAEDFDNDELFALLELKSQGKSVIPLAEIVRKVSMDKNSIVEHVNLEIEDDQVVYELELATGWNAYELTIDPSTGDVLEERTEIRETVFNYLALGMSTIDNHALQILKNSLQKGLSEIDGTVLSIEMETEDDLVFYEVKSFHDGRITLTLISGKTGETLFYRHYQEDSQLQEPGPAWFSG